jgi:hypothetical protein
MHNLKSHGFRHVFAKQKAQRYERGGSCPASEYPVFLSLVHIVLFTSKFHVTDFAHFGPNLLLTWTVLHFNETAPLLRPENVRKASEKRVLCNRFPLSAPKDCHDHQCHLTYTDATVWVLWTTQCYENTYKTKKKKKHIMKVQSLQSVCSFCWTKLRFHMKTETDPVSKTSRF